MKKWLALGAWGLLVAGACASNGTTDGSGLASNPICSEGYTRTCGCDAGPAGHQSCTSSGTWGPCQCGNNFIDANVNDVHSDAPPVCGDGFCEEDKGEDCVSCTTDCGECKPCDYAPSCSGAAAVPLSTSPLPSFDNDGASQCIGEEPDAGVPINKTNCVAPQLKLAIVDVRMVKSGNYNLFGSDNGADTYCAITAQDKAIVSGVITPFMQAMHDGNDQPVAALSGTFWGAALVPAGSDAGASSTPAPQLSESNIQVQYQCVRVEGQSAFDKALGAIAGATGALAGVVPGYGWAFGLGSAGVSAIAAAINGSGTYQRLNVVQTIAADTLLDLTNGKTWKIRQSGGNDGDWEIELTVESWGCSNRKAGSTN